MITPQKLRPRLLPLVLGSALLAVAATGNAEEMNSGQTNSPDILLGPLFNDVQSAKLFPDQNLCRCRTEKRSLTIPPTTACSVVSPGLIYAILLI